MVQLDSDMLVLQNMDELMDIPLDIEGNRVFAASHACVCNPTKKPHYPADWSFTPLPPLPPPKEKKEKKNVAFTSVS